MDPQHNPDTPLGRNGRRARAMGVGLGVVWLLLIALAAGVARSIIVGRAERQGVSEVKTALEAAAHRVEEALVFERDSLSLAAHNAASNPRLMAAVAGRVDNATWDDLLANEPWWDRYRDDLVVGISHEGPELTYKQKPSLARLPWAPLIKKARAQQGSVNALLVGPPGTSPALGVAVATQEFGGRSNAILVFARYFDDRQLAKLSAKSQTPLLLSDGKRTLAHARGAPEHSQEPPQEVLQDVVGREAQDALVQHGGWAARAFPLADGLWMWLGMPMRPITARVEAEARKNGRWVLSAGAVVGLLGFGLFAAGWGQRSRATARGEATRQASAGATQTDLDVPRGGVGSRLGRYLLVDRIGEGGMAEIFTAVSFGTGGFQRSFVVKRLRHEMVQNPVAMAHFFDEANLASQLVHPNIAQVFDFGQAGGDHYLAQEHVAGRDLGRLSRALMNSGEPPLPPEAILYVAQEILSALEYAHDRKDIDGAPLGIVHRDVTPENIMVSERGEVKLLDFGIVKAHRRRASQTEIGHLKGNLDYMSPEQARGHAVDHRSDLFSLGVTLYYCATHQSLYVGDTSYEKLLYAASGPKQPELDKIAALPSPLNALLTKALAASPEDRFQNAAEFRAAVEPHTAGGREIIRDILLRLFEDDILLERDRLAATRPPRDLTDDAPDAVGTKVGLAQN